MIAMRRLVSRSGRRETKHRVPSAGGDAFDPDTPPALANANVRAGVALFARQLFWPALLLARVEETDSEIHLPKAASGCLAKTEQKSVSA
jgi:hypothetical protein